MKTQESLLVLTLMLLFLVGTTSSCFKESCDDRTSTEFINDQATWVPYANGPEKTVFKKETAEEYDTLILASYEFKTITVQNTGNCDKEETHELQRANLYLSSAPASTEISLFQSSEGAGLFSITHDDRELFFLYREKRFELELNFYKYFSTYTLNGNQYNDVLEITCNETTEPCPNYKVLVYQKGGGLLGYQLNGSFWVKVN